MSETPARYLSRGGFFCLFLIGLSAQGQSAEPFATRDQNPLISIYGMPLPVNARLLAAGESHWLSSYNLTNTANVDRSANSELIVDTETSQLDLVYSYGLNASWMLRLHFNIRHYGSGIFDSAIYNYHDLLGFKQGDRDLVVNNRFQIYVSEHNNTLLDLHTSQTGIGDAQIQLGTQLSSNPTSATSLWASLKLPSGDHNKLTGSGNADIALWLASQQQHTEQLWVYSQLGAIYIPDTKVLNVMHRHTAGFGNFGISYRYSELLEFKTQLDAHTPLYNSQLKFLKTAVQLTFGGNVHVDSNNIINIAITEDLITTTSPDVTLNLGWLINF